MLAVKLSITLVEDLKTIKAVQRSRIDGRRVLSTVSFTVRCSYRDKLSRVLDKVHYEQTDAIGTSAVYMHSHRGKLGARQRCEARQDAGGEVKRMP